MDLSTIYVHDGQLLRVIEDAGADTVTMEVRLPATPDGDALVPCMLVFADAYGYQVVEGPFEGCPTLLDMQVVAEHGRWQQVRIDTNAGYRTVFCTSVTLDGHV